MAWATFKSIMIPAMQNYTFGNSLENFAKQFTSAYDISIKTGKTTTTNIPLAVGNTSGMESMLINLLSSTKMSKTTSLLQTIGPAVIMYWSGAQLVLIPPIIPCPGALVNVTTVAAPVISPGVWNPIIVPPNNNPSTFINAFCTAATIHLTTVAGLHNCISNYPGVPVTPGPGVLPWTGYTAG
ncbi:hypothetical protein UFOVP449_65 [uncultured Caudovirales phage]|uniref:Uncharacterized protein n=1 Tax=uncultured Caudovirales phage TaxID=2100421 RepID=A0A6J5MBZ8_9CAUD|nr:hypothetical protein UFOVP449_65 [uncultured Caudovirales phage]